jgi:hypothetical protein
VTTGADTFVFAPGSSHGYIGDFRQSDGDKIDVSAYGFHSMADMAFTLEWTGDTLITLTPDHTNDITLVGFGNPSLLHNSDFIFA